MSDEPKRARSPGVTWAQKAKKYQIQISIGEDAPQLKAGRYDDLEEANARVAPFNELKDTLRKAGKTNKQIHEELVKLRDRDAGMRSLPCLRGTWPGRDRDLFIMWWCLIAHAAIAGRSG